MRSRFDIVSSLEVKSSKSRHLEKYAFILFVLIQVKFTRGVSDIYNS